MKNHSKLSNMPFFPSCQHSVVNNIMFQVANTMWLMTNHSKLPILHAANKMWFMIKHSKLPTFLLYHSKLSNYLFQSCQKCVFNDHSFKDAKSLYTKLFSTPLLFLFSQTKFVYIFSKN